MTIASDIFAAHTAWNVAEDRVEDLLEQVYGPDGWSEFTVDPYDSSIEVYGCTPTTALERFAAAGFDRIWQHPHPVGEPGTHACGCRSAMLARYEAAGTVRIIVVSEAA